ncbi:cytochrome P450 [Flavobacterium sp. AC]|uniref:Cytochrome P450 n=1 Tax=Flavobacterium azizsancarii TaxID=2961580 RepID=A0ABT4WGC6_9FLAO|nr:cytochrome P450 [Flavobacterium azizsancarii]MDA6071617.1 cytochrome P450 [Flavobacterium azizsancarii]
MTTLFFQSDVQDPYSIYQLMLGKNPIYWDEENKIWVIYSYESCIEILKNPDALIPVINLNNEQKLNEHALDILNNLARLSNEIQHTINREIANLLFSNLKSVDINTILYKLIKDDLIENEVDWVNSVCKKLPLLVVLKSFGFTANDCAFILDKIEILVKIMLPNKSKEEVKLINQVSERIFSIVEKQLLLFDFYKPLLNKISELEVLPLDEIKKITISNLIGLLIQSYDAGRGILSNSLLQIIKHKTFSNKATIQKSVIETLRFDPPIHNTRRIANADITLGKTTIKKGEKIMVVLAAANRDLQKFENESNFDIERFNNNENLTFGIGGHMCLAKHFSINLATEVLWFLFNEHKIITLLENNIEYEPLINTRLPKTIWISIK